LHTQIICSDQLISKGVIFDQQTARQATLPRGSFWQAKLTTSDDFGNFSTHVTTLHDLRTTMTTNGDNILMTLKTNCDGTLTTRRLVVKTL
jgi:hypothetical protein